jgi:hypothetical protein
MSPRRRRTLMILSVLLAIIVGAAFVVDFYLGWFVALGMGVLMAGLMDPG